MESSRTKRSGLAEPAVEGVDSLFGTPDPEATKLSAGEMSGQSSPSQKRRSSSKSKPKTGSEEERDDSSKIRRVKTSLYLSQEALDTLHDIKYAYRKSEGRFVPIGELVDRAVHDLAEKVKVDTNK